MKLDVYKRPDKPASVLIKDRRAPKADKAPTVAPRAPLVVDRATECHVTPPDVARRMVEYLDSCGDVMTLEPSAGTGNLIAALFEAGQSEYELCAIERHIELWRSLNLRFPARIRGFNECFLEYADRVRGRAEFPRVIMNPPFRHARKHIEAARSLWGFGGHHEKTIIALVPATFEHDDAETLEHLPSDTFATTKVHSKIIRFRRYRNT